MSFPSIMTSFDSFQFEPSTMSATSPNQVSLSSTGPMRTDRKLSIDTSLSRALMSSAPASAQPNLYPSTNLALVSPSPYSANGNNNLFSSSVPRRRRSENLNMGINAGPYFSPTQQMHNLYDLSRTIKYNMQLMPKMDRGFFLTDNDWTCYRRNYFQVSAAFTSSTDSISPEISLPCLVDVDSVLYTVVGFHMGIMAKIQGATRKIDLVQHTAKRDKGPQLIPNVKSVVPGGNPLLALGLGGSSTVATFDRLQFKTATANNGKRRAAQQYYMVVVELYAEIRRGDDSEMERVLVATSTSAPLVVRGRSPGHYDDQVNGNCGLFSPLDLSFSRRASQSNSGFLDSMSPSGFPMSSGPYSSVMPPMSAFSNPAGHAFGMMVASSPTGILEEGDDFFSSMDSDHSLDPNNASGPLFSLGLHRSSISSRTLSNRSSGNGSMYSNENDDMGLSLGNFSEPMTPSMQHMADITFQMT